MISDINVLEACVGTHPILPAYKVTVERGLITCKQALTTHIGPNVGVIME